VPRQAGAKLALSFGMRFELVAFDLYGTLLDISGLGATLSGLIGHDATALLAAWRTAQIERTWELNRLGRFEPFDRVTAWALERVAPNVDEAVRAKMSAAWLTLPAYPDAAETLARLGTRTAVLSNGTRAMIDAALAAAGIAVDRVRSVEEVGVYKPDPRVYALLDDLAPRAATLFVSANGWDAEGAKRDGRIVCRVDRGGAPPAVPPDLEVRSLSELVTAISRA
jgi:2-haloacid dehalogenase